MNTTATYRNHLRLLCAMLWCAALLGGCKSLETRLTEAETEGRLGEAFELAVEYYDDNRDNPEAKADIALERVGNAYLSFLISSAERALSREEFTEVFSLLYDHPAGSATHVIRAAEARGVQLAKRTVPEAMRSGVMAALESYYHRGVALYNRGDYHAALAHFRRMRGLKDADSYILTAQREVDYAAALAEFDRHNYRLAYELFGRLGTFRDARQMQAQSLERGRIAIAIFGFAGDRRDIIREYLSRCLADDPFIRVVNADNLARLSHITPDIARNANIRYVISGTADVEFSTPRTESIESEWTEAWVVTDRYRDIRDSTGAVKGYVRVAEPLSFVQQRLSYNGSLRLRIEMADAFNGHTVFTDVIGSETNDATTEWRYSGRYSPGNFTVHNPTRDTLQQKRPWRPTRDDRTFQELFAQQRPLLSPQEMAEALLHGAAGTATERIEGALRRLEQTAILSTR